MSSASPTRIVIIGVGGNSIDVLDAIGEINAGSGRPRYECMGFLDDDRALWGNEIHGVRVHGPIESARDHAECQFVLAIGSPLNFSKRESIAARIGLPPERYETIIHPTASVSTYSTIGNGSILLQHVTIASDVRVGDHVMVLPNCVLSHDDVVGDFTSLAGGVCVSGGVTIGRSCYLGTNASVIGNVTIGDDVLIGMGAVVLGDVPENSVYVGNPARFLRRKDY